MRCRLVAKGRLERHTDAVVVYDRFHVIAAINRAVDQVRRHEHKLVRAEGDTTLKCTTHTLRRAKKNMNDAEQQLMRRLKRVSYKVARVWERSETARLFSTDKLVTTRYTAERRWLAWIKSAVESRATIKEGGEHDRESFAGCRQRLSHRVVERSHRMDELAHSENKKEPTATAT